jgi:GNAT superfamily N-acetyltransferase
MTVLTDRDLYLRGCRTALAAWEEYARGTAEAAVHRLPGVTAAVFPCGPERAVYNNAILDGALAAAERAAALDAMHGAYADAGIGEYAAWVHESDRAMRAELERRGYVVHETTRAMGMATADVRVPRPGLDLAPTDWAEYLRVIEVPPDLLAGVDQAAFHVLVARLDGESVAAGMAYDADADCGVYNVGTLERARRHGLGTGLTALLVHDALDRGCRTASLQSTPMGERVYAAVGFRDLGRILEYVPPTSASR